MSDRLNHAAFRKLFLEARTHKKWQQKYVTDAVLKDIVDLMRWGPTSANCLPARFVFVRTAAAKQRLKPFLIAGNVAQTMSAPVCAIIGYDLAFPEQLPKLYPAADARSWFAGNDELIKATAFRNGSLQGGYFILAARALGLDCGPMSGFDNAGVDAEFFSGTQIKSNFLCNLGYGDPAGLQPRGPRPEFQDIARIA